MSTKIHKYSSLALFACVWSIFIGSSCSYSRNQKQMDSSNETINVPEQTALEEDTTFCFLGKGIDTKTNTYREENFDKCPYEVTDENINKLYRHYEVDKLEGLNIYKIQPFQLYTTSQFFTRLIRIENGKQVAARTFYSWKVPYIFAQDDNYMVALNSLATTAGMNTSSFTCKTLLVDKEFNTIKEREYKYPEQTDPYYAYAYIDTIYTYGDGYNFRIINTGFDSDDYYQYTGHLSKANEVTESSKKNIKEYHE